MTMTHSWYVQPVVQLLLLLLLSAGGVCATLLIRDAG